LKKLQRKELRLFDEKDVGKDVRDVLKKKMKTCQVCAVGAVMVSSILRFDNMPVTKGAIERHNGGDYLAEAAGDRTFKSPFSAKQLMVLEAEFEDYSRYGENYNPLGLFCRKFKNRAKRLTAMMENVIRNKGKFVPSDVR